MEQGNTQLGPLMSAAGAGDAQAAAALLPLVYGELRRLAELWLARTPPGQTLQPTALVHDAYLRLMGRRPAGGDPEWRGRAHFFFAASRAMRDILVERARAKTRLKRGGGSRRVDLDGLCVAVDAPGDDLLALDEALTRFETQYPWESRIVMLRFFAGMTTQETAEAMSAPLRTVERDLRFAKAWLRRSLEGGPAAAPQEDARGPSRAGAH